MSSGLWLSGTGSVVALAVFSVVLAVGLGLVSRVGLVSPDLPPVPVLHPFLTWYLVGRNLYAIVAASTCLAWIGHSLAQDVWFDPSPQ
jgi:hypothetical protein